MIKNNKGFTLIELLVVIAIIGILASVVLSSLNTARAKGADAAIKSNLANIRAQAELIYDEDENYENVCTDSVVSAAIDSAKSAAGITAVTETGIGVAGTATTAVCHVSADFSAWAAEVPLKTDSANSWCVDSAGKSIEITGGYLGIDDVTCS